MTREGDSVIALEHVSGAPVHGQVTRVHAAGVFVVPHLTTAFQGATYARYCELYSHLPADASPDVVARHIETLRGVGMETFKHPEVRDITGHQDCLTRGKCWRERLPCPSLTLERRKDDDGRPISDVVQCGACLHYWDDAVGTSWTPAPSGRCPFEYDHDHDADTDDVGIIDET